MSVEYMKYAYIACVLFLILSVFLIQNNVQAHGAFRQVFNKPRQDNHELKSNTNGTSGAEIFRNVTQGIQAIMTAFALFLGGVWAISRFIIQREGVPHIEFLADINIIGKKGGYWIVELISTIENKGKVEHKIENFTFDVSGIKKKDDKIETSKVWGNQINFPHSILKGSHMPIRLKDSGYFFIDPDVKAKYSYVARVGEDMEYIIYHSTFNYTGKNRNHTAEKTVCLEQKRER